jgi:uncharacterized protein
MGGRRVPGGVETAGGGQPPPASPRPAPRSRRILASVGRILLLLVLVLLLAQGALALMISPGLVASFLFFPSREDPGPAPTLAGVPGEDVLLTTPDGTRIHGWWHDAGPDAPAVIHLHGNAGTIAERAPIAAGFLRNGISIFMPDYRGYGRSEGKPVEEGVYEDARTALDWIQTRVGHGGVVLHGASLGGAVAARVAWERPEVAGVILESTFTSMEEMAAVAYPFLPSFLRGKLGGYFNTLSLIPELRMPVLVIHGHADTLIPVAMGRTLHQAAGEGAIWYEVPGAGHNDVFLAGGDPYFQQMADFVRRVTAPPQPRR